MVAINFSVNDPDKRISVVKSEACFFTEDQLTALHNKLRSGNAGTLTQEELQMREILTRRYNEETQRLLAAQATTQASKDAALRQQQAATAGDSVLIGTLAAARINTESNIKRRRGRPRKYQGTEWDSLSDEEYRIRAKTVNESVQNARRVKGAADEVIHLRNTGFDATQYPDNGNSEWLAAYIAFNDENLKFEKEILQLKEWLEQRYKDLDVLRARCLIASLKKTVA